MKPLHHRFIATFSILLLLAAATRAAEVEIHPRDGGFAVNRGGFNATVRSDGALGSLVYQGKEFLSPVEGIARGISLYQDGVLGLGVVAQDGAAAVVAHSEKAEIRYAFAGDSIRIDLANSSTAPLSMFVSFATGVNGVSIQDGSFVRPPITATCKESVWYSGSTALRISGGDRLWGPWRGAQVWEAVVAAGQHREVVLELTTASEAEARKLAALPAPAPTTRPAESPWVIRRPLDFEIVQRFSRTAGSVAVSGRFAGAFDRVEARFTGKSAEGTDLAQQWQNISCSPAHSDFLGAIVVPAGGWYRFEIRARRGSDVVGETAVEHVGVGEVFIGCGQSNSTNYGETPQKTKTGKVATFSGTAWRIADDPQPGAADKSSHGSLWPAFGDAMYEKYRVPIGVAVTGRGATGVEGWEPDTATFDRLMIRILQFGPRGFRAVLWHQGESDANQTPPRQSAAPDVYTERLIGLISTTRDRAGWDIPWFVANATYHTAADPVCPAIRSAQRAVWESGVAMQGPDTDALGPDYRADAGRGVHFSEKGLQAHGRLWAEKVGAYLDKELKSAGEQP